MPNILTQGQRFAVALIDTIEVDLLKAHAAIEKVQRAYGYYVDKAEWPDVTDLYQENGTLEIGGRGVFLGKKRVLEYLVTGLGPIGPQKGQVINHPQFQGIVDMAPDGKTARGRWTALVMGVYPNPVTQRPMPKPNPAAGGMAPMKDYVGR
jgi:hypothetical protein